MGNIENDEKLCIKIGSLYILIGSYDSAMIDRVKNDNKGFDFLQVIYYDDDGLSLKEEARSSSKIIEDLIPGEPFMILEICNNWFRVLQTISGCSSMGWIHFYSSNYGLKRNIYSINIWGMNGNA